MYSLKGDMLLLTTLVKKTLQLPWRPSKPPITVTFPPPQKRPCSFSSNDFLGFLYSFILRVCTSIRDSLSAV